MTTLLLILTIAQPRAPNAVANRRPYYRFDPRNVVDLDPARSAALRRFVAATEATWRRDMTDAELQQWCEVRASVFELERNRK